MGLPDPRDTSSLLCLRLVLAGIERSQAEADRPPRKPHLLITQPTLERIRSLWNARPTLVEYVMPRAAVMLFFFGFFRSAEVTVPSWEALKAHIHLGWGDAAIDNRTNPRTVRVQWNLP